MNRSRRQCSRRNRSLALPSLKCIWMMSGVVDYKLCDREYECENCPFDQAIRDDASSHAPRLNYRFDDSISLFPTSVPVRNHEKLQDVQGYRVSGSLFYHPAHIWARVEDGGKVRIGLDDFGQKLVSRIYSVKLPEPATQVFCGTSCWQITHKAGETNLVAPLTGFVLQLNQRLGQYPSLINDDPYGQGWAMVMEPENLMGSLRALHYGQQAERWYDQEITKLHQEIMQCMDRFRPNVGATLQDGGFPAASLINLDVRQLREVINIFLSVNLRPQTDSDPEDELVR